MMVLKNLAFEEWLRFVFDHRVISPVWYQDLDAEHWAGDPTLTVDYITRAFENSAELLQPFSNTQLEKGFWFLMEEGEMRALFAESVPLGEKLCCIRSIFTLFKRCFAHRCSESLLHRDEQADPLNSICYMWWDVFPTCGAPLDPKRHMLDSELLAMMRKTLTLDSEACRESALHGLSHWHLHYPRKVEEIIDEFLTGRPRISRHLIAYARAARNGAVQ